MIPLREMNPYNRVDKDIISRYKNQDVSQPTMVNEGYDDNETNITSINEDMIYFSNVKRLKSCTSYFV